MLNRPDPRRGELYWLDWNPAPGSEQAGRRPALIVSNDGGNRSAPVVIVVALTTRMPRRVYSFHVRVTPIQANGLAAESTVLCEQIMTVAKERLVSRMGSLAPETMRQVDAALRVALDLV